MLAIRLRRMGNRNRPFYRVVVSDSRRAPTSSAIEEIGHYHPGGTLKGAKIDLDRLDYWVGRGARPSPTVTRLVRQQKAEADAAPAEPVAVATEEETAAPEEAPAGSEEE